MKLQNDIVRKEPDFGPLKGRSPLAVELVKLMLTKDPERRPSAEECLKHPWFFEIDSPDKSDIITPPSALKLPLLTAPKLLLR